MTTLSLRGKDVLLKTKLTQEYVSAGFRCTFETAGYASVCHLKKLPLVAGLIHPLRSFPLTHGSKALS